MSYPRPPFQNAWQKYVEILGDGSLATLAHKVGGELAETVTAAAEGEGGNAIDANAIRMSYCLNHTGVNIVPGVWETVSGGDGRRYISRIPDLIRYLKQTLGRPDKTVNNPKPSDFAGQRGILVFGQYWSDASGHTILWDGRDCADRRHFPITAEASLWELR